MQHDLPVLLFSTEDNKCKAVLSILLKFDLLSFLNLQIKSSCHSSSDVSRWTTQSGILPTSLTCLHAAQRKTLYGVTIGQLCSLKFSPLERCQTTPRMRARMDWSVTTLIISPFHSNRKKSACSRRAGAFTTQPLRKQEELDSSSPALQSRSVRFSNLERLGSMPRPLISIGRAGDGSWPMTFLMLWLTARRMNLLVLDVGHFMNDSIKVNSNVHCW